MKGASPIRDRLSRLAGWSISEARIPKILRTGFAMFLISFIMNSKERTSGIQVSHHIFGYDQQPTACRQSIDPVEFHQLRIVYSRILNEGLFRRIRIVGKDHVRTGYFGVSLGGIDNHARLAFLRRLIDQLQR